MGHEPTIPGLGGQWLRHSLLPDIRMDMFTYELPRQLSGRVCLPMQETKVQSLGREDPLEKEMATRSSILAWEIPWTEEPGGLQSIESVKESDNTEHTASLPS